MAGKFQDKLQFHLRSNNSSADRDLPAVQAVERARAQTQSFRNAMAQFNQAVQVGDRETGLESIARVSSGSGARTGTSANIATMLRSDYLGTKEAEIRVQFDPGAPSLFRTSLGTIDVTPENMDRLVNALSHAAREANQLKRQFGNIPQLTPAEQQDIAAEVELRARQVFRNDLRDIIPNR